MDLKDLPAVEPVEANSLASIDPRLRSLIEMKVFEELIVDAAR